MLTVSRALERGVCLAPLREPVRGLLRTLEKAEFEKVVARQPERHRARTSAQAGDGQPREAPARCSAHAVTV